METVCLRYSNVYGDNQPNEGGYCNVSGIFTRQRLNGEKMSIVGDGNQRRDFINVDDVATANMKVGSMKTIWNGDVINDIQFSITNHCNAACPQCNRTDINGLGTVDWLPVFSWSLDEFKTYLPIKDDSPVIVSLK